MDGGYTEPDPRDDLSGMDVARKILILAREIGLKLELRDIKVEDLISQKCKQAGSVEEFFAVLESEDEHYSELIKKAENEDKVLRYIATLEGGKIEVSLESVGPDHPFYSLFSSDNIVSFTTNHLTFKYKNISNIFYPRYGSGGKIE